jgi:hypothetical protein
MHICVLLSSTIITVDSNMNIAWCELLSLTYLAYLTYHTYLNLNSIGPNAVFLFVSVRMNIAYIFHGNVMETTTVRIRTDEWVQMRRIVLLLHDHQYHHCHLL